jgi:hypothetical protein
MGLATDSREGTACELPRPHRRPMCSVPQRRSHGAARRNQRRTAREGYSGNCLGRRLRGGRCAPAAVAGHTLDAQRRAADRRALKGRAGGHRLERLPNRLSSGACRNSAIAFGPVSRAVPPRTPCVSQKQRAKRNTAPAAWAPANSVSAVRQRGDAGGRAEARPEHICSRFALTIAPADFARRRAPNGSGRHHGGDRRSGRRRLRRRPTAPGDVGAWSTR